MRIGAGRQAERILIAKVCQLLHSSLWAASGSIGIAAGGAPLSPLAAAMRQ
jgi:hypothetical protein